jgi:uncharacterized protein YjbI with pentapeptide repeats
MSEKRNIGKLLNKLFVLNGFTAALLVILLLILIFLIVEQRQQTAIQGIVPPDPVSQPTNAKEPFEIAKLKAEIQQIRSDTSGSLFWLKLIAVFVTVGGAVGGYFLAQTKTSRNRIEFEDRKNVDTAYQSIIQELSNESALLRAAAVVKFGAILESFPSEWNVSDDRKAQLRQLTKQVLAAALSTEDNSKVLKTITISIVLHKDLLKDSIKFGNLQGMDLSGAKAADAYWAKVDFTYTDFYKAILTGTSFRKSILQSAQFREATLNKAVFVDSDCTQANFKLADLRDADFTGATISQANFEGARIHGVKLDKLKILEIDRSVKVDNSPDGDGSQMITVKEWLEATK